MTVDDINIRLNELRLKIQYDDNRKKYTETDLITIDRASEMLELQRSEIKRLSKCKADLPCEIGDPCIVLTKCYCYDLRRIEKCKKQYMSTIKYIARVNVEQEKDIHQIAFNKYMNYKGKVICLKMYERPFRLTYLDKIGETVFVGPTAREDALAVMKSFGEVMLYDSRHK